MLIQFLLSNRLLGSETAEPGGIASLGVDLKALLLQIVTFLLVFFLLKKFALDKIVATLEKRRQTIDDGVQLGQEMAAKKAALDKEVDKILHKARLEADKIIAAGHTEVGVMLKEAEDNARRKSEQIIADASRRLEEDVEKARQQLEKEMLKLVSEATGVIIGQKLDATHDRQLIESVLKGVSRP